MRFGLPRLLWHAWRNDWSEDKWLEEVGRFELRKRWFFWLQRDRENVIEADRLGGARVSRPARILDNPYLPPDRRV